jgi:hypothetical protein
MPITEKGTVEYNMPASIKESFTMEFLIDIKKKVVEISKKTTKDKEGIRMIMIRKPTLPGGVISREPLVFAMGFDMPAINIACKM